MAAGMRRGRRWMPPASATRPDRDLRQRELGMVGHHHQVGGQGKLAAAGDGDAVDGGDDRLRQLPERRQAGKPARAEIGVGRSRPPTRQP